MLTCDYGTSWLGINGIVILISILIITLVYLLSRTLPSNTKAKITGITKTELTQIFISIFILALLFAVTSSLCSATSSISNTIAQMTQTIKTAAPTFGYCNNGIPCPALAQPVIPLSAQSDPFSYSESYIGQYAFNIGPLLGIQVDAYSYAFGLISLMWYTVYTQLSDVIPTFQIPPECADSVGQVTGVCFELPINADLGAPYSILTDAFIDAYAPLTTLGIAIMLVQYLILAMSQLAAFTVLLPVALVLRSLAFSGGTLRLAANSVLAASIALYIIYPVMIVFDSYAIAWMFTPCIPPATGGAQVVTATCNPSFNYLDVSYTPDTFGNLNPPVAGSMTVFGVQLPNIFAQSPSAVIGTLTSLFGQSADSITNTLGFDGNDTIQSVAIHIAGACRIPVFSYDSVRDELDGNARIRGRPRESAQRWDRGGGELLVKCLM